MFLGEYSHSLDAKGRIFIPSRFREQLSETFVVARSFDTCLAVYPPEKWSALKEKIDRLPELKAKKLARFLYPSASEVTPDSQGRILLPQTLRDYASLSKNAAVIGMGDYVEIWDEEAFAALRREENTEEIIEIMKELDF